MDDTNSMPSDLQRQQDRKRKGKAILAGGVVLGLGAAVTLAAWSDDVFANGDFNTGSFNLIGSASTDAAPDVSDYAEWDAAPGADLSFQIAALNLSPGETVAAPFSIAQAADTTIDGRVWMYEAIATGTLSPHLSYDIKVIGDPTECVADDPTSTSNEAAELDALPSWNEGTFSANPSTVANYDGQREATTTPDTQDLRVNRDFGNQQHLCIQVTLADDEAAIGDLDRSENTTVVWQFKGESETPSV